MLNSKPHPSKTDSISDHSPWGHYVLIGFFSAAAFTMLVLVGLAVATRIVVPRVVEGYTAARPTQLPAVDASEEDREAAQEHVDDFVDDLKTGSAVEPLVLTARDLNTLLQPKTTEKSKGESMFLRIADGRITSQFSVRINEDFAKGRLWRLEGRYVNGTANLGLRLERGRLKLEVKSLSIDGGNVPGWVIDALGINAKLAKLSEDPDVLEVTENLSGVDIDDGQIILRP